MLETHINYMTSIRVLIVCKVRISQFLNSMLNCLHFHSLLHPLSASRRNKEIVESLHAPEVLTEAGYLNARVVEGDTEHTASKLYGRTPCGVL